MNSINLNQTGGVPIQTETLMMMPEAYKIFNQFANIISRDPNKRVIIAGCETVGNTVSSGYVCINNEILPLKGDTIDEFVHIEEIPIESKFKSGEVKTIGNKRFVTFGAGAQSYRWDSFTRYSDLRTLHNSLNELFDSFSTFADETDTQIDDLWTSIEGLKEHGEWEECFEYGGGYKRIDSNPLAVRRLGNGLAEIRGSVFISNKTNAGAHHFVRITNEEFAPDHRVVSTVFRDGEATMRGFGNDEYLINGDIGGGTYTFGFIYSTD